MKYILCLFTCLLLSTTSMGQILAKSSSELRAESLRGKLTPLRTCYDINYYHLDVKIDLENQSVNGSNEFNFTAVEDFNKLQFDLFRNLKVERVIYAGVEIPFTREADAVFITFPKTIKKGEKDKFTVWYGGTPKLARNPPWDGGFIFSKDNAGNPFASVACQGLGASVWWPNKDHQSDEVDSMLVSITVPKDLHEVSNGRLRSIETLQDGSKKYNWIVSEPINNYNVTFYIGKYAHWTDNYDGEKGNLSIDYWSLKTDSAQAKPHWDADTKRMLKAFEFWFGPYPWYKDGFKLVQAPHLGMEHQSAIAYGNQFKKGYLGMDMSGTGHGLDWDYIIIHEAGHEWFGNNITTKDIADMWVHEGFTTYSEALFTEYTQGRIAGDAYVIGLRKMIGNDSPLIGKYDSNSEGSGDMYAKGANIIHTIRQLINDDEVFRQILRGLNKDFYHQTVTTNQIENYISQKSGIDLSKIFDQYLRHSKIPVLEYSVSNGNIMYRWVTDVKGFNMPIKYSFNEVDYETLNPTNNWQNLPVKPDLNGETFKIKPSYYVNQQRVIDK